MSDRSDKTGPAPETPGGRTDAAPGETPPEVSGNEPPPPATGGEPSAADDPDDTIPLPADATTVRPTDQTTSPPTRGGTGRPTGDHATTAPATSAGTPANAAAPTAPAVSANDTTPLPGRANDTTPLPTGTTETTAPPSANTPAPDRDAPTRLQPAVPATELDPHTTTEQGGRPAGPLQHTAVPDRPGGTPFLTATGLTAHGRQGPIFTDVTVHANLGQLVAICGDGGEGRTSLLLALTGRFPFHSGALEADGQTRPGQIRRRFTIAQAGPPIRFEPYATVGACIKETTTVSKGAATRANINAWLDRLAVGLDTGDTFGFLPRIDQIRFAIACAAAARTPAIAVDDTDTGLDRCGSERVFEALRTVAGAGQLVLAVTTRSDPPADTVVDLRAQPAPDTSALNASDRNGGHR